LAKRIRVAVLFGGRSAEHEVSLVSAGSILQALDPAKYEVVPVGITREGRWLCHPDALDMLKRNEVPEGLQAAVFPAPAAEHLLAIGERSGGTSFTFLPPVDVFFPVLHGTFGEDGTVQGLFELMDVPYVGAGVLASALGMDKVVQKELFRAHGLPVVDFLSFRREENPAADSSRLEAIEARLGYPVFVKPANLGSSVGISKAKNRADLRRAIGLAFSYDRKIIIEKGIERPREIEVSVLGNEHPRASLPGEVIPSREFYDYEAKYVEGRSELKIPAPLPQDVVEEVRRLAVRAFRAIDCEGMARVDFLLAGEQLFVSELNTIPGFTAISMYPKLWEVSGLPFSALLDELIQLALDRHKKKAKLRTRADVGTEWYRR